MSARRPAPADAPSTYVDPDYRRRQRDEQKAADERFAALCGSVEVRRVPAVDWTPEHGDEAAVTTQESGPLG